MLLKELRLKRKLSLQRLAKELNVGYTSLFNWENGYANPTQENYTKIISFFNEVPTDIEVGHRGAPVGSNLGVR